MAWPPHAGFIQSPWRHSFPLLMAEHSHQRQHPLLQVALHWLLKGGKVSKVLGRLSLHSRLTD